MNQTQDEKLEILSDVLPEVNRFTAKAKNFQDVLNQHDAPDYVKRRSWRSLQRYDRSERCACTLNTSREIISFEMLYASIKAACKTRAD